jgi:hypothetical protein
MSDVHPTSTIAFQPEAFESAANVWRRLDKHVVEVTPTEGEPFDAVVGDVVIREANGQYAVVLAPADDAGLAIEDAATRVLDIYDEIERVEVY